MDFQSQWRQKSYTKINKRVDGYKIFNNTLKKSEGTNTSHYFFGNTEELIK